MATIGGIPGGNYARDLEAMQRGIVEAQARAALHAHVALARQDWDQDEEAAALSPREAARSIRNCLHLPGVTPVPGSFPWQDHGTTESVAYRRILEATEAEIDALDG
jgi:hypothetical protein